MFWNALSAESRKCVRIARSLGEAKKPGEEHHKQFLDLGEVFPGGHERPAFNALRMLHNLKSKGSDLLRDFTGHHPLPHLTLSCFLLFSL